jgi:FAD/FMN-containing dehydrogenase
MDELIETLRSHLGPDAVLVGEEAQQKAVAFWSRLGAPRAVLLPRSTEEVSLILKLANQASVPVSAWGGKTGLVDGAQADGALALSLERMNRIEQIDAEGMTMTVQAGCILQVACEAAEAEGLYLPLDLGARGSATIGGNISTNAGGNRVIRYGMTRDMVLGLEAVLADGTVISSLNRLIKNNTGYDLKQLFIGSEGTLGVVTRAVIRLRPRPASQDTAIVGVETFGKLVVFLRRLELALSGGLSAYEVMWNDFYQLVTTPPALGRPPLAGEHPYYVLVESLGADQEADSARFEAALVEALESGDITDAAIAKSHSERQAMWALRDDVAQVARNGPIFTFDIGLSLNSMESYVAELRAAFKARWPQTGSLTVFGHLGDGNLHVIAGVGSRTPQDKTAVQDLVYGGVRSRGGSVSAEHGIGLDKKAYLGWSRNEAEIALMRTLKTALDPKGILNPGKIFAAAS